MAEVLGTVASGLQVATLAAKIMTVGFKVRTLYREMQGASAQIAASLDDIHLLAQILEELGKSPMATHVVLLKARSHCEQCLQELQATLHTLQGKIQTSRGILSKFLRLGIVIHKHDVAKMEHRLETSVRLVLFAIQIAMFASQQKIRVSNSDMPSCIYLDLGLPISLSTRNRRLIESQSASGATFYASIARQSCFSLGKPCSPAPSRRDEMYLMPRDTDEDTLRLSWLSIFVGGSRKNVQEVCSGFARGAWK